MKKLANHGWLCGMLVVTAWLAAPLAAESGKHFNSDGYRDGHYRSPLPENVTGGTTLSPQQLQALIAAKSPALIDVQAVTLRTEAVEFGLSWLPSEQRFNIPGSSWLPNVGYGELESFMAAFFRDNLARLTANDKTHPVVFYCIADCWMSWYSVRRAHQWGYTNLYWLRDGTDGWVAAGFEVVASEPESIIDYLQ